MNKGRLLENNTVIFWSFENTDDVQCNPISNNLEHIYIYDIIYIVNAMSLRLPNDTISHQYMYMFRIVSIQSLFDKNDKISTRLDSRSRMKQCRFKCLTGSRLYVFSA